MFDKRKETMRQFCVSNTLFFSELAEKKHVVVDKNFKIELMLIYCLLHKEEIKELSPNTSILEMIEDGDFYVEEEHIIYKGEKLPLEDIYLYLEKLNAYITSKRLLVLDYPFSNVAKRVNEKNANMASLTQEFGHSVNPYIVTDASKDHLNNKQLRYFQEQKKYNKRKLARLIFTLIQGDISYTLHLNEVMELYALVNLYPVCSYDKKEEFHKKSDLSIDSSSFYKKIMTYSNQQIRALEKIIQRLNEQIEKDYHLLHLLSKIKGNSYEERHCIEKQKAKRIDKIEKRNLNISGLREQLEALQNNPNIANPLLLSIVWKAMIEGTYDKTNGRNNARIILYNVEGRRVTNCIENNLEATKDLVSNNDIISQLEKIRLIHERKEEKE